MASGDPTPPGLGSSSTLPKLLFIGSAASAAVALRVTWEEPVAGIVMLGVIGALVVARWLSRRRTRRLLQSGDVEGVVSGWARSLRKVPHPATMGPLMRATAFAAYGWVERARESLRAAERGPAWDAALEHRLFVDTLLLTFEGDLGRAHDQADALARLPLPDAGSKVEQRVKVLRAAVAALARAFAHSGRDGDRMLLLTASHTSPLIHWAMRYGAAIMAVDAGELTAATALLENAPEWPIESKFRLFHSEISAEVSRLQAAGPESDGAQPTPSERSDEPSPADDA